MKVKSIAIVGGGTAGWMTAAYVSRNFPDLSITIIDKEIGNPIGVGEATLLNFKAFMDECGFSFEEWMVALDAGYKSGIIFTNWTSLGNEVWHPFKKGARRSINNIPVWELWTNSQHLDFKEYALNSYNVSTKHNGVDFNTLYNYGFHVDCGKLVLYIQNKLENKVRMIKSDVVKVGYNADDVIDYIELKNSNSITADIYIDATGFRQVLRKPKKRIDLMDRLFVNTAVVCQVPYQNRTEEFKPYAICDATDHGWLWKIGVSSRIGSGMIFNRNITDVDEAKDYFVKYWNNRISKENVRCIEWDPYYIQDCWSGNIVNIGLSAGFLEPIESTGIGLIIQGVTELANAIKERWYSTIDIQKYNLHFEILYEDAVDFISAHYANNKRQTPFWSYVQDKFKPSNRMLFHIEQLSNPSVPLPYDGRYNAFFSGMNWTLLLIQLGYPVAVRDVGLNALHCEELIIKNFSHHEKNRHIWSRKHADEIDRQKNIFL